MARVYRLKLAVLCRGENCGKLLSEGTRIVNTKRGAVGVECCEPDADNSEEEIKQLLPRNPKPMCPKCFQIPSANGSCGCDA